jgi:hypothetical protein
MRAKLTAALGVMAVSGALSAAIATPLPIASQAEAETMAGAVDYRRCIWADGQRLCRSYYNHESYGESSAAPDYGYYGAPGIYLGFGAGRGPLHDADGQ